MEDRQIQASCRCGANCVAWRNGTDLRALRRQEGWMMDGKVVKCPVCVKETD